jgi:hypothetical protein
VQTLHQRKANEKFAKLQEKKMGKPESAIKRNDRSAKAKVSGIWLSEYYRVLVFAATVAGIVQPSVQIGR